MVSPIRPTGGPLASPPASGATVQAAAAVGQARVDPREAAGRLHAMRDHVVAALERGDGQAALQGSLEAARLAEAAAAAAADAELRQALLDARAGFLTIARQVEAAAPPAPAAPPAAPRNAGPLGRLGGWLDAAGGGLEKGARWLTKPLTWVGEHVLEPVKRGVGWALGGAKTAIDESLGRIPVVGTAVRFTTGLAASVVGVVDGLLTAVFHPVDTIKGLGGMLWTVSGLLPGPKMIYDGLVHGKSPLASWRDSWAGSGEIVQAMFAGAIADWKAGNYAGAVGRLTGDVGSLFLGGAGAARAAAWAGRYGRVGAVAARGITTLGRVVTVDAKLMELGAAGAGKLAGRLARLPAADKLAGKLAGLQRAMAHDARLLKGVEEVATQAERVVSRPGIPAAMPKYVAPSQLEGLVGRKFEQLVLPQADGKFVRVEQAVLDHTAGQLRFQTANGMQVVPETMVDRLLYHPENARLLDSLRAPEPAKLKAIHDVELARFEVPRGDGSFTSIERARVPFVDDKYFYVYDGDGVGYRVPHDRLARALEHPGNQALVDALSERKVWSPTRVERLASEVDGVKLAPRTPAWREVRPDKEIRFPTRAAPGGVMDGKIVGVSVEGKLTVYGELDGARIAKELDAGIAFTHNPGLVYGYPWGTAADGTRLALGEFDAATGRFKTIYQDAKGGWFYGQQTIKLDDVMRNARPFTDLPMVKVTPDVRVIPYDEVGISIGEGAGFKIKSREELAAAQRWYAGHMEINARVYDGLKADKRFVAAVRDWHGLSEAEKLDTLRRAMVEFADKSDVPLPELKLVDNLPPTTSGQFSPRVRGPGRMDEAPGVVEISRRLLNRPPAEILDTVIHETAHARQWHALERYRTGHLDPHSPEHFFGRQFQESWDQVGKTGDHYEGYRNNLIEQDAWSAGTDFGRRIAADPAFMPPLPTAVKPTRDWARLAEPLRVGDAPLYAQIQEVAKDGAVVMRDHAGGVHRVRVRQLLEANPDLFNHLDFGTSPGGGPLKIGRYNPITRRFGTWEFDGPTGSWVYSRHTFAAEDVLRLSQVMQQLVR